MTKLISLSKIGLAVVALGSSLSFMPGLVNAAHAEDQAPVASADAHPNRHGGLITAIDTLARTITVSRHDTEHVITISDDTKLAVPPDMHANLDDFKVGDRITVGLNSGSDTDARVIISHTPGARMFARAHRHHFQK